MDRWGPDSLFFLPGTLTSLCRGRLVSRGWWICEAVAGTCPLGDEASSEVFFSDLPTAAVTSPPAPLCPSLCQGLIGRLKKNFRTFGSIEAFIMGTAESSTSLLGRWEVF